MTSLREQLHHHAASSDAAAALADVQRQRDAATEALTVAQATLTQEQTLVADLRATALQHDTELADLAARCSVLAGKEQEWIDWNAASDVALKNVWQSLGGWATLLAVPIPAVDTPTAVEVGDFVEVLHGPLHKRLELLREVTGQNKRLEEALRKSEAAKTSADDQHESLLKQIKTQYDGVVKQLAKMQGEAREALAREDAAQQENARLRSDAARLQRELALLRAEQEQWRARGAEDQDAEQDRIDQLERELTEVEAQLTTSEGVIAGLHAELARRDRVRVQDEAHASQQTVEKDALIAGLHTQVAQLRVRVTDLDSVRAGVEAAAEARVQTLQAELAAVRLDLTAAAGLGADLDRLTRALAQKSSECDRHAVAVTNLHALLEQVQAEAAQQQHAGRQQHQQHAEAVAAAAAARQTHEAALATAEGLRQSAEQAAAAAQAQAREDRTRIDALEKELAQVRAGLHSTVQRMSSFTAADDTMIDRRFVSKLLVSYFEHNQPHEVCINMSMVSLSEVKKN